MICYSKFDRMERRSSSKKKVPEVFSDCGTSIGITYEYQVKDGIKSLVPAGEIDRQELIDSFTLDSDVNVQIGKFLNGDTSVLNPNSGSYGDFTNYPTTYAELFERVQNCKNVFDSMPTEIKEKFDNSYESFWSQFGSERFDNVFSEFNKEKDVEVTTSSESEVENA